MMWVNKQVFLPLLFNQLKAILIIWKLCVDMALDHIYAKITQSNILWASAKSKSSMHLIDEIVGVGLNKQYAAHL